MRHVSFVRAAVAVLLCCSSAVVAQSPSPSQSPVPAPAARHVLQGAWVITTLSGQPAPADTELVLTVAADGTYIASVNGKVDERGSIQVDASKKPMTIDFLITEGSSVGKTQLGVFQLTADSLTLALAALGNGTRPMNFVPTAAIEVIVLKKKT